MDEADRDIFLPDTECPSCGYELVGDAVPECPECGAVVTELAAQGRWVALEDQDRQLLAKPSMWAAALQRVRTEFAQDAIVLWSALLVAAFILTVRGNVDLGWVTDAATTTPWLGVAGAIGVIAGPFLLAFAFRYVKVRCDVGRRRVAFELDMRDDRLLETRHEATHALILKQFESRSGMAVRFKSGSAAFISQRLLDPRNVSTDRWPSETLVLRRLPRSEVHAAPRFEGDPIPVRVARPDRVKVSDDVTGRDFTYFPEAQSVAELRLPFFTLSHNRRGSAFTDGDPLLPPGPAV